MPTSNSDFWIGTFAIFTDKGLCVSTESCSDLLASLCFQNDRLKILGIVWDAGNFYRYRLQILGSLSGKHFGWKGTGSLQVTLEVRLQVRMKATHWWARISGDPTF